MFDPKNFGAVWKLKNNKPIEGRTILGAEYSSVSEASLLWFDVRSFAQILAARI